MERYKSKVDLIYDVLIQGISEGRYVPGEHLVISQISKQNNVSDIPVREAIRRLESEGYVRVMANQGAIVADFSPQHIVEIFRIKAVLEAYATRVAIDYITKRGYTALRKVNNNMQIAFEAGHTIDCARLNSEFHMMMYDFLPHQEMRNMIADLYKKYSITKSVFNIIPSRAADSYVEHEELLKLMEAKEYDAVEALTREHKLEAADRLLQLMLRQKESS